MDSNGEAVNRGVVTRVFWILLAVGVFGAAVGTSLATRVENLVDTPLVWRPFDWRVQAVPLTEAGEAIPGTRAHTYHLLLHSGRLQTLLQHPEIRVLVATYQTRPRLLSARLRLRGTPCAYETRPDATLVDNEVLPFVRGPRCAAMPEDAGGDLELTLRTAARSTVAVWTFVIPADTLTPELISVADAPSAAAGLRLALRGAYVDYLPESGVRRVELLNYMWQISPRRTWIWLVLGAACLLLMLGLASVPMRARDGASARAPFALRVSAGTFCLAAALALLYSVLVPPLHAPDELAHLLGYGELTSTPAVLRDTADWAGVGHFDRIHNRSDQRFRPSDIDRPRSLPDEDRAVASASVRSRTTLWLWEAVGPRLRTRSAPLILLSLRLINALLFAAAMAIGALAIVLLTDVPSPQLVVFVFLLIPTLPFFATHVSNYGTLVSAYVASGSAIASLFLDGRRSAWIGLLLGLALALALASGRDAVPMMAMVGGVLLGRVLLGSRDAAGGRDALRGALVFWCGVSAGVGTAYLMLAGAYAGEVAHLIGALAPGALALSKALSQAWLVVPGTALAGTAAEMGCWALRRRLRRSSGSFLKAAVRWLARSSAAAIAFVMCGSLFLAYPHVSFVDPDAPPAMRHYLHEVLLTATTSFRLRDPDLLLWTSFWGGFGWVDRILSPAVVSAFAIASGVGLIGLLLHLARSGDARRFVWLIAVSGGLIAALALYAVAAVQLRRDLHGRYLIGLYLCMVPVCWSLPALAAPPSSIAPRLAWADTVRVPVLLGLCGLVHAWSLTFILSRYF